MRQGGYWIKRIQSHRWERQDRLKEQLSVIGVYHQDQQNMRSESWVSVKSLMVLFLTLGSQKIFNQESDITDLSFGKHAFKAVC